MPSYRKVENGSEDFQFVSDLYHFSFPPQERETMENIMRLSDSSVGRL
jgi:hypothetical protein